MLSRPTFLPIALLFFDLCGQAPKGETDYKFTSQIFHKLCPSLSGLQGHQSDVTMSDEESHVFIAQNSPLCFFH